MTNPQCTPSQITTQSPRQVKHVHALNCYKDCADCALFDPDKVCASCGNRCTDTLLSFMVTTTYIRDDRIFRLVICGDCVGEKQRPRFYLPKTKSKTLESKDVSLLPEIDKKMSTLEVNLSKMVSASMHQIAAREPRVIVKEIRAAERIEQPKTSAPVSDPQFAGTSVVYFIQSRETGFVKIGYSGNVQRRLLDINQVSPGGVQLLAVIRGDKTLEGKLHQHFARFSRGHEWFIPDIEIFDYISEHCERNTGRKA